MRFHVLATRAIAVAVVGALLATAAAAGTQKPASATASTKQLARGQYLVKIGGCNNCHTPGYFESAGKIPEKDWLVGDELGWRGPWGTTYPVNLRLYMQSLTEQQWLTVAKTTEMRPPMPWFTLRAVAEADLKALYQYVRHLGPAGKAANAYLPPDKEPQPPFVQFPAPPK